MISVNATLIIQIIHFLLLVFILNRIMFRPIMRLIDERGKHIEDTKKQMANIEMETNELANRCLLNWTLAISGGVTCGQKGIDNFLSTQF